MGQDAAGRRRGDTGGGVSGRGAAVVLRLAAVLVIALVGFAVLQGPSRRLETRTTVALLGIGGHGRVFLASATSIGVVPARHAAFRAVVTPTCSALSSVLAIGCLASLAGRSRRRLGALITAVVTVTAGNVLRIGASILVGLLAGRSSLVLFHDWVGSAFAFAYTLGGYVLMLYLLLPRHRPVERMLNVAGL
jgi:carbamoyl-phosphate synthase large subunit